MRLRGAVAVPVTVKMRRGLEHGSRTCLEVGPRLVEAGAQALTLHPRSATQMYTGAADHALTAELVDRVPVPVIASGDVTSRARALEVLEETGAAAVMVGRAAQGNPWVLAEIMGEDADAAGARGGGRGAAVLHRGDRPRARRAAGDRVPEEVLRLVPGTGRFPKPFKQELVQLRTVTEVEERLLAAAPGAAAVRDRLRDEQAGLDEILLELPISAYGGG